MRAFEVFLNDQRLCVAGIGDEGVLDTIVNYVIRPGRTELYLTVGGLFSPDGDHVTWSDVALKTGDEVRVKIIESVSVDEPSQRERRNPEEVSNSEKDYVRKAAKKFGWTLTENER